MNAEGREVAGVVLDENTSFTLRELCQACGVSAECVFEMIEEGVVEPAGNEREGLRFRGTEVRRVQTALRLTRDLRVNLPGAALALDLLDELAELRRHRAALLTAAATARRS